jgi:four helix bundle protein
LGSATELEYHLLLAYDLGMLGSAEHVQLEGETTGCKRMLAALAAKVASDRDAAR